MFIFYHKKPQKATASDKILNHLFPILILHTKFPRTNKQFPETNKNHTISKFDYTQTKSYNSTPELYAHP